MTTYALQTQPRRLGDLLIFEMHSGYQRASAPVKNASAAAVDITDPLGYPVKTDGAGGYALAFAGDEASVIGLILFMNELSIGVGVYTPFNVPILIRGPGILNYSQGLPTLDAAGASFNITTIVSTLKAISPPLISYAEPTLQATQSS